MPSATKTATDHIRLCDQCLVESDGRWYCGIVPRAAPCSRCASWEASHVLYPAANEPRLEGDTRWPEFTTSVTVEPYLPHVWDVNRYYADLGVHHRATKAELRDAYVARGGHGSARLTFVLKQLLNDEVRARYDATPLGSIFFDAEIAAVVRQRIADEVRESRMVAPDDGQGFVEVDLSHLMDQRFDFLDKHPCRAEDDLVSFSRETWGWYRWATPVSHQYPLSKWRGLLAKALSDRGVTMRLAVGWHNQPEPWIIRSVGRRTVLFLNTLNHPDPQIAEAIADTLNTLTRR